ncbi:unnamed protein product, partial [Mesorhabditis belari]|uniref:Aquaporin n=1 Tax=Mesorhabditis belari TaxID=2138241 RepID=A0AAF3F3V8_9BILA
MSAENAAYDPPYRGALHNSIDQRSTSLRRMPAPAGWEEGSVEAISVKSVAVKSERKYSLFTKCVAEFLGDLTFVFIGTMQGYGRGTVDGTVHAALAHGFAIFILVTTLGHISGGHFNPAVTWSVVASGRQNPLELPFYWASQLFGGFCGSMLACAILSYDEMVQVQAGATLLFEGDPSNLDNSAWWQGLLSETVVTFFLCHTILMTAVDTDKNLLAPLAIGFTLSIDILATGAITGASMNPARSFGPNVAASILINKGDQADHLWSRHYIYWAGPLVGASIAAAIYRIFEARTDRFVR